jgi:hypothetical protein
VRRRRARDDSGSAALEYILVLGLCGLLMLSLTGSTAVSRSRAAVTQAVCRLFTAADSGGAGACGTGMAEPPPTGAPKDPCVRSSTGGAVEVELNVFFVDLGGGEGFMIEELSNGKYRVVWNEDGYLGATATLAQGEASVRVGANRVGLGGRVAADAGVGGSEVDARLFDNEDAAVDYVVQRALDEGTEALPHGPREVVQAGRGIVDWITGNERDDGQLQRTTGETSIVIGGEASATLGPLGIGGEGEAAGRVRVTENADGTRAVALALTSEGVANLGVPLVAELGRAGASEFEVRLTMDADGNLTKLRVGVMVEGALGATVSRGRQDPKQALEEVAGSLRAFPGERTVFFSELRLDNPQLQQAAAQFVRNAPRAGVEAVTGDDAALRQAAADLWSGAAPATTIATRSYRTTEGGGGLAAKLRVLDVGGGVGADVSITTTQLQSATYWDTTNGGWVRDTACLGQ